MVGLKWDAAAGVRELDAALAIANQQLHSAGRGAFVTYLGFITLSRVTRLMSCGGT